MGLSHIEDQFNRLQDLIEVTAFQERRLYEADKRIDRISKRLAQIDHTMRTILGD